ncbi:MAG: putative ribonuclease [Acidimicrobiaceae bacterium]|nr:putative ribonuclease [Acidimicrobiaceae bacterium]
MNAAKRLLAAIDRFQQRHRALAFVLAVQKKVGDDNAGNLAVNLAYSGFLAVFPLMLVLVTVLGLVANSHPAFAHSVERSALANFPIIGSELQGHIQALHRNSTVSLVIGLLGLVWGATGLSQTAMFTMSELWNIPGVHRFGFVARLWRSFAFLAVIAGSVVVAGFLSSFGVTGGRGVLLGFVAELLSALINFGAYLLAFRVLTPKIVRLRQLLPGSAVAAIAWTVLQAVGGLLVQHDLKNASAVYGFFGIVLGLIAWLYLAARICVYAVEINTVLAYHLWPRSLVQPPLLDADRRSLTLQVTENQRRPEQRVSVSYGDAEASKGDGDRGAVQAAENGDASEARQAGADRST